MSAEPFLVFGSPLIGEEEIAKAQAQPLPDPRHRRSRAFWHAPFSRQPVH